MGQFSPAHSFDEALARFNAGRGPGDDYDSVVAQLQSPAGLGLSDMLGLDQTMRGLGVVDNSDPSQNLALNITKALPELFTQIGSEKAALEQALSRFADDPENEVFIGRNKRGLEYRLQMIDNFFRGMQDPTIVNNFFAGQDAFHTAASPEVKATFWEAIKGSVARTTLAAGELLEQNKIVFPDNAKHSAHIALMATGHVPMSSDPIEVAAAIQTREMIKRTSPWIYAMAEKNRIFSEQEESGFLGLKWKTLAAEAIAFAPLALVEGFAIGATFGAAGPEVIAFNAMLGAAEVYAMTPGDHETRTYGALIGGTLAAGLTAGLGGLGTAMANRRIKLPDGAITIRGKLAGFEGTPPVESTALVGPVTARVQLSKTLKIAPERFIASTEEEARKVLAGVMDETVDAQTLSDLYRETGSLGVLADYISNVRRGIAASKPEHPFIPDLSTPGTFLPRAKARAEVTASRIYETLKFRGVGDRHGKRIAGEILRLGGNRDLAAVAAQGSAHPEFRNALGEYVERLSSDISERLTGSMRDSQARFPWLTSDDLDHVATRLHDFMLEGQVRGIDVDVDLNVVESISQFVDENLARSHGLDLGATAELRGRVRTFLTTGGTLKHAAKKGKPRSVTGKFPSEGEPKRFWTEEIKPAFRIAIDLFADPRPGRLAEANLHELAHVYINAMSALNPKRYRRLAAEVQSVYARHTAVGDIAGLDDPLRVGELFAELLTNNALIREATSGEGNFLAQISSKFGQWVSGLLRKVDEWKAKFWRDGGELGPHGFSRQWSSELRQVSDKFARGDWAGIMDDIAALDTPRPKGLRPTMGRDVSFELLTADDVLELGRLKNGIFNKLALLKQADADGRLGVNGKQEIARLSRDLTDAKRAEAKARREVGKRTLGGKNRQDQTAFDVVKMQGLGHPYVVPKRTDVRPFFQFAFRKLNWRRLAKAFESDAKLTMSDGTETTVRTRLRELALWFERSGEGGKELLEKMREVAKGLPGYNKSYWDAMTHQKVMSYLAANGANRGPRENLRQAVQLMVYNQNNPGGHMISDGAAVWIDDAMRANVVHQFDSFGNADAIEVLQVMQSWGNKRAQEALADISHPGAPRPGEPFHLWLRRTSRRDHDGSLKVVSYERGLGGFTDSVTNDVWQWRFFLHNNPDRLNAIYGLGNREVEKFRAVMAASRETDQAIVASARNNAKRIDELTNQLPDVPKRERARIEAEIDSLKVENAKIENSGARFYDPVERKWKNFEPNKGEYFMMEDAQHKLAQYLNNQSDDDFWSGPRVQSAIWSLVRGDKPEGNALFDRMASADFLSETERLLIRDADKADQGLIGTKLAEIMEAANDIAVHDRDNNMFARTAQELKAEALGDAHPHNAYMKHLSYRHSTANSRLKTLWDNVAAAITSSGNYPAAVARIIGAKRTLSRQSSGIYGGVPERNVQISVQGTSRQADRMASMHAGLNFQESLEWAAVDTVEELTRDFDPFKYRGLILKFTGKRTNEEAEAAFADFWQDMGAAVGKPKEEVISGATTFVEDGVGQARITAFDGYGIGDWDAIAAHGPRVAKAHGVSIHGWTGEATFRSVWDELDTGVVKLGNKETRIPDAWTGRWNATSENIGGANQPRGARAVQARLARRGDIAAARHLYWALEGLGEDQRKGLLRAYALAVRSRLTEMNSFFQNPLEGAERVGAAITNRHMAEYAEIANGRVARLLADIEDNAKLASKDYVPVVTKKMVDDAFKDISRWRGIKKLPAEIRMSLGGKPTAIKLGGFLTGARRRVGAAGVKEKPSTFHEVLNADDALEIAEVRAREASLKAAAVNDVETAQVRASTAHRASVTREWANFLTDDASVAEATLAVGSGAAGSPSMVRMFASSVRHFLREQTRNRFEPIFAIDEVISSEFSNAHAADTLSRQIARRLSDVVLKDLSPEEKDLFEAFLHHEKAKVALARAGGKADDLGEGIRNFLLDPIDEDRIRSNPAVMGAVNRHKNFAQPEIEKIFVELDPANADILMETESGAFIPSIRYNPAIHGKNVKVVGGGTRSTPARFNVPSNSPFTKRFAGTADAYLVDYEQTLRWKLNTDLTIGGIRKLVARMEERGWAKPAVGGQRGPDPIMVNGKEVTWARIQVSQKPTWVKLADDAASVDRSGMKLSRFEEYWVPKPFVKPWDELIGDTGRTMAARNVWHRFADFSTAFMLMTVAEATRHSLRVLSMLARVPRPDFKGNAVELLVPYFGVRFNRVLKMMNVYNHPDSLHLERWMARINALPNRAYEEIDNVFEPKGGAIRRGVTAVHNRIIGLAHRGRGFLFDSPEVEARGWALPLKKNLGREKPLLGFFPVPHRLWGFDVRARIVATHMFVEHLKATGKIAKNVDIAELAAKSNEWDNSLREFITQFGMFNTSIQTRIVQAVRKSRLNPFAGAQGGFRPAEVETLFGLDRLPKKGVPPLLRGWYAAQVLYGGWLGYMAMLMIANKTLSGKWPWQNQEGHEFDLDVGLKDKDGAPAYISANLLEPVFGRSARTVGAKALFDERLGATPGERLLGQITTRGINEPLGFFAGGPPIQAASVAISGKAPYVTGTGEFLRVAPARGTRGAQALQNIKSAFVNMNANFSQLMAEDLATTRHAEDPMLRHAFELPHVILGRIGGVGRSPLVEEGLLARSQARRLGDVAFAFVEKYHAAPTPTDKNDVYQEYLREFPAHERSAARQQFWGIYQGIRRSRIKRAAESRRIRSRRESFETGFEEFD